MKTLPELERQFRLLLEKVSKLERTSPQVADMPACLERWQVIAGEVDDLSLACHKLVESLALMNERSGGVQ